MRKDVQCNIDAIEYVGGRDSQEFTILPYSSDDLERVVVFSKGEVRYSGIDIKAETVGFLLRDYKGCFLFRQQTFQPAELFKMQFKKLVEGYSLSADAVTRLVLSVMKEVEDARKTPSNSALKGKVVKRT